MGRGVSEIRNFENLYFLYSGVPYATPSSIQEPLPTENVNFTKNWRART